jgi:adenylosuccinate lyase
VGRTHGIHAEPTTFGLRLAGFAFEADRNLHRLERAIEGIRVGKLSGAVGTYASVPPSVERRVMESLGLRAGDVSTQVVPRDRHPELASTIALAGAGLERFATEVRNLQRTEVREVSEPFGASQKGSSAMPHKRNPILSERLSGLARVLRGYLGAGLEDVALWHERDISHSSVERIILPDASLLAYYVLFRMAELIDGLVVSAPRMLANFDLSYGLVFSQPVLLSLIQCGLTRDAGYGVVQRDAMISWQQGRSFRSVLEDDPEVTLDKAALDEAFDLWRSLRHVDRVFAALSAVAAPSTTEDRRSAQ